MIAALLLVTAVAQLPFADRSPKVELEFAPSVSEARRGEVRVACEEIQRAVGPVGKLVVVQHPSTSAFVQATGRARFEAAALAGSTMHLQPEEVLARFPAPTAVFRHECVHAALSSVRGLPRMLQESFAITWSGQAAQLPPGERLGASELQATEAELSSPKARRSYERALRRVVSTFGDLGIARDGRVVEQPVVRALAAADGDAWLDVTLSDGTLVRDRLRAPTGGTTSTRAADPAVNARERRARTR